jgi:hypothetical protein
MTLASSPSHIAKSLDRTLYERLTAQEEESILCPSFGTYRPTLENTQLQTPSLQEAKERRRR